MSASVFARLSAVLLLGSALAGCFGGGGYDEDIGYDAPPMPPPRSSAQVASALPQERGTTHVTGEPGQQPLQCVPYAREHSDIKIQGDANTWWNKASGKYERGAQPATGAVMVLFNYSAAGSGHVAVVRRLVSSREIRVDHANWLNDGSIYVNDPVVDVSAANDWSQVKVWNIKTGGWGTKIFPVQGFIGQGSNGGSAGAPRGQDDDALPPDDALVASTAPDDAEAAALVQRIATSVPTRPKPKPARTAPPRAASPIVPVAMTADDRNPAPDSGFALTDQDREIP
jgi:hypothetical protein